MRASDANARRLPRGFILLPRMQLGSPALNLRMATGRHTSSLEDFVKVNHALIYFNFDFTDTNHLMYVEIYLIKL